MTSFEALLDDLDIPSGGLIYLQSSFSRLKHFGLSGQELLDALRRRVLPRGTLIMPSYPFGASPGKRLWDGYISYINERPVFDARNDPALIGYIPELFRRLPSVQRSLLYLAPTCAEGPLAHELTQGQERVTHPYGPGSTFRLAGEAGATMLGLGVTLDTTSLCLLLDYDLGERHPAPMFTRELQRGAVRDWNGREHETWCSFLDPSAMRFVKPSRVFDRDKELRARVRRLDIEGIIHFAYPYKAYERSAMRAAEECLAAGEPLPWFSTPPVSA